MWLSPVHISALVPKKLLQEVSCQLDSFSSHPGNFTLWERSAVASRTLILPAAQPDRDLHWVIDPGMEAMNVKYSDQFGVGTSVGTPEPQ